MAEVKRKANLLTIFILSRGKCGLSSCIIRYLKSMAIADLLVLLFNIILYELNETYFPNSFLNFTTICSLKHILGFAAIDCSVWLTVSFTCDRFIAICCQRLRVKYCTETMASIIVAIVCMLSILENIPVFFVFEPGKIVNGVWWYCTLKSSFYTLHAWVTYSWMDSILTPFIPFFLILIFNALTIRHILMAKKIRKGLRGKKHDEHQNDSEDQNRRKSIILLVTISASFVLLWIIATIHYICVKFTDAQHFYKDYSHSLVVMQQIGYMLQLLSPCTNTFIYAVAQTKFRTELIFLFKYALFLIPIFIKYVQS
ncbi:probable G-protein coupled receptor 139 [Rhincodon typus]|uniref:probable G-protein coupled receptor 139 n=1 Tax=Rhincodon typus TaxID=259920 RepID=UPI00202DE865|nr:probable G-protein coupled receptor 139 [Rhincodon typus]